MAYLPEEIQWGEAEDNIYQLELQDFITGGEGGNDNEPHRILANRTRYLKKEIERIIGEYLKITGGTLTGTLKLNTGTGDSIDDFVEIFDNTIFLGSKKASLDETKMTLNQHFTGDSFAMMQMDKDNNQIGDAISYSKSTGKWSFPHILENVTKLYAYDVPNANDTDIIEVNMFGDTSIGLEAVNMTVSVTGDLARINVSLSLLGFSKVLPTTSSWSFKYNLLPILQQFTDIETLLNSSRGIGDIQFVQSGLHTAIYEPVYASLSAGAGTLYFASAGARGYKAGVSSITADRATVRGEFFVKVTKTPPPANPWLA